MPKYKILLRGNCQGIRTNCITGNIKTICMKWVVKERSDNLEKILYLENGPTGYESAYLTDLSFKGDWCACAGIKCRWDTLEIPKIEMKKIHEQIKNLI